jgi:hypothetical protein
MERERETSLLFSPCRGALLLKAAPWRISAEGENALRRPAAPPLSSSPVFFPPRATVRAARMPVARAHVALVARVIGRR